MMILRLSENLKDKFYLFLSRKGNEHKDFMLYFI